MMCEWILIPALEHPLQQLIHSVFGLPPAPPYVNAKFPWERITSDTTLNTRLKSKQVRHKKNVDNKKKANRHFPWQEPLHCYAQLERRFHKFESALLSYCLFSLITSVDCFFSFKDVLILWTSSNQFCNQSSIRLEKSWISFDYP